MMTKPQYVLVDTEEKLADMLSALQSCREFGADTETTGLNRWRDHIVGLGFSVRLGQGWYVPVRHLSGRQLPPEVVFPAVKQVYESVPSVWHNAKFDVGMLWREGIDPLVGSCSMVEAYLLGCFESLKMHEYLAPKVLKRNVITMDDLFPGKKRKIEFAKLAPEVAYTYGAQDADLTLHLHSVLYPQVKDMFLYRVEMGLIKLVLRMENWGIRIDQEWCRREAERLRGVLAEIERLVYRDVEAAVGSPVRFSLTSTQQLADVLFGKLKLEPIKFTEKGKPSTADDALAPYRKKNAVVHNVLTHREILKALGTYIEKFPEVVAAEDGRLHTTYRPTGAETGRFASEDPNIQNIPREVEWKYRDGDREVSVKTSVRMAVMPDPDFYLVEADYSQIELRVYAGESGEPALMRIFREGQDAHAATASLMLGVPLEQVTKEQRQIGKTFNFALLYGQGVPAVQEKLGSSRARARELYDAFFRAYPVIERYRQRVIDQAKMSGYAQTHFGRKNYIHEFQSPDKAVYSHGERVAVNTVIQGSAADILKIAMNRLQQILWPEGRVMHNNELRPEWAGRVRVVMTTHDSLTFEVHKSIPPQVLIDKILRPAMDFEVKGYPPIIMEAKVGLRYGALEEWEKVKDSWSYEAAVAAGGEASGVGLDDDLEPGDFTGEVVEEKEEEVGRVIEVWPERGLTREQVGALAALLRANPGKNLIVLKLPDGDVELEKLPTRLGVEDAARFQVIFPCRVLARVDQVDARELVSGIQF